MDPWTIRLDVVRGGSHTDSERRSLARQVERGPLLRLRTGAYVARAEFEALTPEGQHVVRARALSATADGPVTFSHATAAVLHGLPVTRSRLGRLHATVTAAGGRGAAGVAAHVFPMASIERTTVHGLLVTTVGRTVVDVAGAWPFAEAVAVADAVLRAGVRRAVLEEAAVVAGARQARSKIAGVIAFAHPGAESANESFSRAGMLRLGLEPPELQHPVFDALGLVAWLDFWFRRRRVGGEADGKVKLLDPSMATQGAGRALWNEKRREDRVLPLVSGLARWGYEEAVDHRLLGARLAAFGVVPGERRATLADYAAAARDARPRPRMR